MNKEERIGYIDVYRGIGIWLMIMGHVGFGTKFDYWIHAFHMPMWFMISGYFFKGKGEIKIYAKKKASQLLTPYFSFGGGVLHTMAVVEARYQAL